MAIPVQWKDVSGVIRWLNTASVEWKDAGAADEAEALAGIGVTIQTQAYSVDVSLTSGYRVTMNIRSGVSVQITV